MPHALIIIPQTSPRVEQNWKKVARIVEQKQKTSSDVGSYKCFTDSSWEAVFSLLNPTDEIRKLYH